MLKLWTILEKNILPMEAGVYCHHICDYSSDFVYYHHIYCYSSDVLVPQVAAWLIHPLVQLIIISVTEAVVRKQHKTHYTSTQMNIRGQHTS
jgi:hypothetical protein